MSSYRRNQEKKNELIKHKVELAQAMKAIHTKIIEKEYGTEAAWAEEVEKSINVSTSTKSKSKPKSKSKSNIMKNKVFERSIKEMGGEQMKAATEEQVKELVREEGQTMVENPPAIKPKEYFIGKYCDDVLYEGIKSFRISNSPHSFIKVRSTQIDNIDDLIDITSNTRFLVTISGVVDGPDGFPMLVGEPVVSITSFFKVEANLFASEENMDHGSRSRWWTRISETFRLIFGNVIHGLMYLHSLGHKCGDITNHMYVSANGEGKVLPLMDKSKSEEYDVSNLIKKMKEIITLPFTETEVQEGYKLPGELSFMLRFVTTDKLKVVPSYWLLNQPYFWLSREKVHFVKDFTILMKEGVVLKDQISFFFKCNLSFASEEDPTTIDWSKKIDGGVCNGLFKMVYDGPKSLNDTKEYDPQYLCDLFRYMTNCYNHADEKRYAYNHKGRYSENEIEACLYSFFPMVYVAMYAALYSFTCSCLKNHSKAFGNWPCSYLAPPKTLAASMDKVKKYFELVQAGSLIDKPCVSKSGLSPSLKELSRCAKELGNNQILIPVKKEVMNQIQNLYFGQDEIVRLLEKGKLDAAHISTYIRLLYEDCLENGLTKTFGFLCPSLISSSIVSKDAEVIRIDSEQRSKHILNALHEASDGKIYLAPFNIGDHWILCLINPIECIVYYLDPLRDQGREIEQDLCNVVNTALRLYWKQPEKSMTWKQIQCPQQDNIFDCGYYVLRFMREIIDHQIIQIPEAYFDDCAFPTYDQGQINEVRDELACHALRFYVES